MNPDDLWQRTLARTTQALASEALRPIETSYEYVDDGGVRFLVRVVANLRRKDADRRAVDPFSLPQSKQVNPFGPHDPELFVADLSSTHVCLLNKYNVVRHHLLLVTRAFEDQRRLLSEADCDALWRGLADIDGLGFYNGGADAGASQPHKHLQLVPLPLAPKGPAVPIAPLLPSAAADEIVRADALPFEHACACAPWGDQPYRERGPATHDAYLRLLRRVGLLPRSGPLPDSPAGPYNLLCTRRWMLIVPRSREYVEGISLNALGYGGALLVRTAADLARLKALGPMTVLERAAVAPR